MSTKTLNLIEDKITVIQVMNKWLNTQTNYNGEFSIEDYRLVSRDIAFVVKRLKDFDTLLEDELLTKMKKDLGIGII